MPEAFDELKATQAAALFLKNFGGRLDRLKFVKLMYLMDRAALFARAVPVTDDTYFSLEDGPVPSNVYNLLRRDSGAVWPEYISSPSNVLVELTADPGTSQLDEAEVGIIARLSEKFRHHTGNQLRAYTHRLPEYTYPGKSSLPIEISDILKAAGYSPEGAQDTSGALAAVRDLTRRFG